VPRPSLDKVSFWHCSFWSPAETFLIVMDFAEKNIFLFLFWFFFAFSMLLFLLFCLLCSCPQMFYSLSALDSTSSCCGQVNQPVCGNISLLCIKKLFPLQMNPHMTSFLLFFWNFFVFSHRRVGFRISVPLSIYGLHLALSCDGLYSVHTYSWTK